MLPFRTGRVGAVLTLALLSACGSSEPRAAEQTEIAVVDDAGHAVRLAAPARRIVSLIPARTDAILALGGADRLIARTRWDGHASIAHLPSIDNALTPAVEWLIAQRPDLVIAWPDGQARTVVTRLRELGVPVYASSVETIEDLRRAIDHLGTLLGMTEEARRLLGDVDTALAQVRRAVADSPAVPVAYLLGVEPPTVAGPGTYLDEVLTAAGGRNVFGDAPAKWPQVSLEEFLRRAPAALIISNAGSSEELIARLRAAPGWRELAAVRAGRVHTVDADSVNRPGPTVIGTVQRFAEILHPGAAR